VVSGDANFQSAQFQWKVRAAAAAGRQAAPLTEVNSVALLIAGASCELVSTCYVLFGLVYL